MVRPVVVGDPTSKVLSLVVCGSLSYIDDPISVSVCRFKELGNLKLWLGSVTSPTGLRYMLSKPLEG